MVMFTIEATEVRSGTVRTKDSVESVAGDYDAAYEVAQARGGDCYLTPWIGIGNGQCRVGAVDYVPAVHA